MNKKPKFKNQKKYKVTNWKEYNKALVNRGDITLYISEEVIKNWNHINNINKKKGGQQVYSDLVIETCLTLGLLNKRPLRATEGFVDSIFKLLKLSIKSPDYTTMSRRSKTLNVNKYESKMKGKIDILIDSTGIKISGSREWEKEKHGLSKKTKWVKLHIATNEDTGEILAWELTEDYSDDAAQVENLLDQIENPIKTVKADGAYDEEPVYKTLRKRNIKGLFPPRKDSRLSGNDNPTERDWNIDYIKKNNIYAWAKKTGYNKRNRVENSMFRFKNTNGDKLRARNFDSQKSEVAIGINLLNKMTKLGMSKSRKVLKNRKIPG